MQAKVVLNAKYTPFFCRPTAILEVLMGPKSANLPLISSAVAGVTLLITSVNGFVRKLGSMLAISCSFFRKFNVFWQFAPSPSHECTVSFIVTWTVLTDSGRLTKGDTNH